MNKIVARVQKCSTTGCSIKPPNFVCEAACLENKPTGNNYSAVQTHADTGEQARPCGGSRKVDFSQNLRHPDSILDEQLPGTLGPSHTQVELRCPKEVPWRRALSLGYEVSRRHERRKCRVTSGAEGRGSDRSSERAFGTDPVMRADASSIS